VNFKHVEVGWEHRQEVVDDGLDFVVTTTATGTTTANGKDG